MSKIICDICGTSYADSATQCPICGCVRPAQPQPVPDEQSQGGGYTYVKGGRFSKANVKKRTAGNKAEPQNEKNGKKGTVLLLIAIILVGVIALGAVLWATGILDWDEPTKDTNDPTPAPTEPTVPVQVPCVGISVAKDQYTLAEVGDVALISLAKTPVDTTDPVVFLSENEDIATVDSNGKVTAVQNGTTNIMITCGNFSATCEIIVGDGVVSVELVLKEKEIVLTQADETFLLYDGPIPVDQITWVSDMVDVASVSNGVVTAHAGGLATITATYMDQSVKCDVLCDIPGGGSSGGITEDGGSGGGIGEDGGNVTYKLHSSTGPLYWGNDITIEEGDYITLSLESSNGNIISVDWTCEENIYVSTDGGKIKALKKLVGDYITVRTVYENKTYTCKIRVS